MDQEIRNKLRNVVTRCRRLLEDSISQELEGKYGVFAKKDQVTADPSAKTTHLTEEERAARKDLLDHLEHLKARGFKPREALEQLVREIAFTHLNRLCAYKMMEAREVYIGGQKFREAVSRGVNSNGVKFYLAEHPDEERLFSTGHQDVAYRHFLDWLGGTLSQEIGVLFSPTDPANRVYPPRRVLDEILDLLNSEELEGVWAEDETIGWVYQYFTPKELRDQARKESQAPRNSYELAFRNQFFTPRYVVEFLTDNTLGRIWYEMQKGKTPLKDQCRYMVRRPDEVFLADFSAGGVREGDLPPDLGFLLGNGSDFEPFELPRPVIHPSVRKKSGTIVLGWVEHDEAGDRLMRFAHYVRSFDWVGDPRMPELRRRLEEWNTGAPDDPLEGATQDLWDLLLAVHRAERFGAGDVASHGTALTRMANEIRRRLLASRMENATQEELLRAPVLIRHRPRKDPREIKILDPACGSGHFLLYCFDLLITIYDEAYGDPDLGPALQADYPSREALRSAVPGLILRHNLHGIDIDLRCTQIAALALWLRCQRAYRDLGLKTDRPAITRSNIVCAEPMPGEEGLLEEFLKTLRADRLEALIRRVMNVPEGGRVRATAAMADSLCDLVRLVWDKMRLAGEAGSLLKIEEELQDAIRQGQDEWEERLPLFRLTEYGLSDPPAERLVRFVPGDVEGERLTFWDRAESLVLAALNDFAAYAQTGGRLQRRLFVDDAVQGFAFVDLCRGKFDVVLMNPPFGDAPHSVRPYLNEKYPNWGNDVYVAFGSRALSVVGTYGSVGAITSRLGFFLSSFSPWREQEIMRQSTVSCFADLGYGVLDEALVEVAAWALLLPRQSKESVFIRLLGVKDKEEWLLPSVRSIADASQRIQFCYLVNQGTFSCVEASPFCYWVSDTLRKRLQQFSRLNEVGGDARQGMSTADDERYLRLAWEVGPEDIGGTKRWVLFAKGGEYSPYYDDIHLVVDWNNGQSALVGSGAFLRNQRFYLRPGLTYSQRSTSAFNPKILPADCIFSTGGHGVFMDVNSKGLFVLGVLSSRVANLQVEMAVGSGDDAHSGSAARNYLNGMVNGIRFPTASDATVRKVGAITTLLVDLVREKSRHDETTRLFVAPFSPVHRSGSLAHTQLESFHHEEDVDLKIIDTFADLDETICYAYGLDARDQEEIDLHCGSLLSRLPEDAPPSVDEVVACFEQDVSSLIAKAQARLGSARFLSKKAYVSSRRLELAARTLNVHPRKIVALRRERGAIPPEVLGETSVAVLQYSVGVFFGRWDVRFATGHRPLGPVPAPFESLPAYPPGMLVGDNGLAPKGSHQGYPLRIDGDGVVPNDPDHSNDIVRRVRDVIEVIWNDRADAIEKEACEILGVDELRDYFRKPGAGGFWDDHVKRYSKSRRKAPIYWLLQSSRKNYALWIYYHRLDKDILFKALLNYVEPKIRLETSRLEALRDQKSASGESGKEAKRLAKEAERQEDFVSELRDFEDKLRRAANLHLDPDLNDGVVLNIAPLHELVPWKEAKNYWDELLEGKYEWSTIGKQLREKGIVPC